MQCADGALQCSPVTCFVGSERTGVSLCWLQLAMHRFSVSQAKQCTMKIEVLNSTSSGEHKVHPVVMHALHQQMLTCATGSRLSRPAFVAGRPTPALLMQL